MNKYEVLATAAHERRAFVLDALPERQRKDFPWVVWGPRPPFALGEVKALFASYEAATQYARVMNAVLEGADE